MLPSNVSDEKSLLRVLNLSSGLKDGGASRGTDRIVTAVSRQRRVDVENLNLSEAGHQADLLLRFHFNWLGKWVSRAGTKLVRIAIRFFIGFSSSVPVTLALFGWGNGLKKAVKSADLVHLHWIGDLGPSLRQIGRIQSPIVWTLHDMWTFLGIDRFAESHDYRDGYRNWRAVPNWRRSLVNRFFLLLKLRYWKSEIHLVAPSHWMAEQAKKSPVSRGWSIDVIPMPIDTKFWTPGLRSEAQAGIGLPTDRLYLLFGAVEFGRDKNKGFSKLREALALAIQDSRVVQERLTLLTFGSYIVPLGEIPFPHVHLGTLDDGQLREAYRAADLMAVPSRIESFGQTAAEAASCGLPVVAFRTSGLIDVVADSETGVLVPPFSTVSFAEAISQLSEDNEMRWEMGRKSRERACRLWSEEVVGLAYLKVYEKVPKPETRDFLP